MWFRKQPPTRSNNDDSSLKPASISGRPLVGVDMPWSAIDDTFCRLVVLSPLAFVHAETGQLDTDSHAGPYGWIEIECNTLATNR